MKLPCNGLEIFIYNEQTQSVLSTIAQGNNLELDVSMVFGK